VVPVPEVWTAQPTVHPTRARDAQAEGPFQVRWEEPWVSRAVPAELYLREFFDLDADDLEALLGFQREYGVLWSDWAEEGPWQDKAGRRVYIQNPLRVRDQVLRLRDIVRCWRYTQGDLGLAELEAAWESDEDAWDLPEPASDQEEDLWEDPDLWPFAFLVEFLGQELAAFRTRPLLHDVSSGREIQLSLRRPGLYEALCLQLANHMAEGVSYRTCRKCGRMFVRQRGRAEFGQYRTEGKLHFCSTQCASAATQQEQRRRQKEARRLAKEGLNVEEIALAVGSRPEAVARWLGG
jgi:hypothetical protein